MSLFENYYPNVSNGFNELYSKCKEDNIYYIDFVKSYTSILMNIEKFVVYNFFERPRKYNGQNIEDYNCI